MPNAIRRAAAAAILMSLTGLASAQALQEVRVSSQPALLGSVPFLLAAEKDWWKEVGLKVTVTNFPAGAPQIAANSSWDIGYTGSVPAVLGAARFNLHTIALSDDQSATNAIYVRGDRADAAIKTPVSLKGQTVFLTGNSTVDLATRSCLQKMGLQKGDVTIRHQDDGTWRIDDRSGPRFTFAPKDLRFFVIWKALVFRTPADAEAYDLHTDDLKLDQVWEIFARDFRERGERLDIPADPLHDRTLREKLLAT